MNKELLLGETFFYLLDYVTRRSEKLGFQKKKKKGFCLTPLRNHSFLGSSEIAEKIIISKFHSTLVNYVKIVENGSMSFSFFCDRRSEKFQLM